MEAGEARLRGERADAKELGDALGNTTAPEAVEVEVRAEVADF